MHLDLLKSSINLNIIISFIFAVLLLPNWSESVVLPNCPERYVELLSNQKKTVYSPNYLPNRYGFPVPSACQFTVSAPIFHNVAMNCNFYVADRQTNCEFGDSLWVQLDGTSNLGAPSARRYCGSNQVLQQTSMYNSITMGYTATKFSGFYQCEFTAVPTSKCDCGQRLQTRIVGGENAVPNTYPYFAVLIDAGTISTVRGGATIISSTAVLTAAHVFIKNNQYMNPPDLFVSVGRNSVARGINEDTPYSANYEVAQILRHPQYDPNASLNDIAVILTKQFINFNRGVGIACLPGLNEDVGLYNGQRIIEMGFGTTDYGGAFSKVLKQAYATVIPNTECKQHYEELTNDDLCTSTYQQDRNDTCQGDSGGPIVLPSFRDFVIGTVKDGIYCGGFYPGKCQRVSPFRPWIVQVAGPNNYFCHYKN